MRLENLAWVVFILAGINSSTDLATNQDYRGQVRDLMDGRVLITTDDAGDEVLRIKSEGDKKKEENMEIVFFPR